MNKFLPELAASLVDPKLVPTALKVALVVGSILLGLPNWHIFSVGCVTLRSYLNLGIRLVTSRTNHRL